MLINFTSKKATGWIMRLKIAWMLIRHPLKQIPFVMLCPKNLDEFEDIKRGKKKDANLEIEIRSFGLGDQNTWEIIHIVGQDAEGMVMHHRHIETIKAAMRN